MDSDVVSEIAERIVRQKTNEIRRQDDMVDRDADVAGANGSADVKMDARTLDTLRRHIRDHDSGKFFSLLRSKTASEECDDNAKNSSNNTKKRLRPGVRSQQLSELVERAVEESSLIHALVACKALACQIRTNGSRAEPLHKVASKALQTLAKRFVPSVSQIRDDIQLYWKRHMLEGWQSRCSLTCVWRGHSRCRLAETRSADVSVLLGEGLTPALSVRCQYTRHWTLVLRSRPSSNDAEKVPRRAHRMGLESPLAPNTVSRPDGIYPDVWRMLGFKPTLQSMRGSISTKMSLVQGTDSGD